MELSKIYNKLISTAGKENWKVCFFDSIDGGDNVIKVYDFKTQKTLVIYKFSVNALAEFWPSMSNNGEKVGFWLKENSGESSLYVINIDGSNLEKIITITSGYGISWDYDDKRIAFAGVITKEDVSIKNISLFLIDIKNKKREVVIKGSIDGITNQSFSPDGQKILYGYKGNILLYNFLTKGSIKIAQGEWFAWSPKGDWVVYLDNGIIKLIDPDTLQQQILVENKNISVPIYWLPNGEYIVYGIMKPGSEIGSPYVVRLKNKKVEAIPDMYWIFFSWAR